MFTKLPNLFRKKNGKESKYLLHFSLVEGYLNKDEYTKAIEFAEEIGAMLWKAIESLNKNEE